MSKGEKNVTNIASGNARVGVQTGRDNIRSNGDGTWTVNGKSVGVPRVAGCGCPGADTYSLVRGGRECVRCGRVY